MMNLETDINKRWEDGDNGEHMMFLLDIYFEAKDKGIDLETIIKEVKPAFLEKIKNKYPGS